MKPKLKIIGTDGNAYALLGAAKKVARKAGWSEEQIKKVMDDAMSGDYNHLLSVLTDNFDVS